MTTPVITIAPDTTVREIATLLLERRISGLPVVEDERVVGIVSEGDLLRRHEIDTHRKRALGGLWSKHRAGAWWMQLFMGEPGPAEYVKSHALHAADVMTRTVVSVSEDLDIEAIATLFGKRRIKRVPVMRDGRLVGIVTRANLVQAVAAKAKTVNSARALNDDAIRALLLEELGAQAWWRETSNVLVTDGVVTFWGVYETQEEKQAARVAAENISGVRRIDDHRISYAELPSMG
jgi:CBS domain-containing protein